MQSEILSPKSIIFDPPLLIPIPILELPEKPTKKLREMLSNENEPGRRTTTRSAPGIVKEIVKEIDARKSS